MTAQRGWKLGLTVSALLALAILAIPLIIGLEAYDGECLSFEPPPEACTLGEYLGQTYVITLVYLALGKPALTIGIAAVILLLPPVGRLVGGLISRAEEGQPD